MERFNQLQYDEMQEINGGLGVLETVGIVVGIYAVVREMVKEAGRRAAYRDLNM